MRKIFYSLCMILLCANFAFADFASRNPIIQDEGTTVAGSGRILNFTGAGVTVTFAGGKYVITIAGGAGTGDMTKAVYDVDEDGKVDAIEEALLVGANETYGSGWNADTGLAEKDDIYDYLHLLDTNDDGDIDTIDATLWATKQAADADLTIYAGITPSANVQSLLGAANYAAMRTLLDLEAGTDFYSISAMDTLLAGKQTADADLDDLADGSLTASKVAGVADADYGDVAVSGGAWTVEGYQTTLTNSAGLLGALNDETGIGLAVFNNSPTFADDIQLGLDGADGILKLYSEQGATDYIASLYANTAMTSAASFFLPADEPAATSFINMTTGGVMGFVAPHAGTNIAADLEEEVTEGSLADNTIVSADIKDGTITDADIDTTTPADVMKMAIHFTIDGGGSAITTGVKSWVRLPFNCTITAWELTVDTSATITIDVWRDTYANFPPDNTDTLTNAHEPAIAAGTKAQDLDITDWTDVTLDAGDYIKINVDANDNATRAYLTIYGYKT